MVIYSLVTFSTYIYIQDLLRSKSRNMYVNREDSNILFTPKGITYNNNMLIL